MNIPLAIAIVAIGYLLGSVPVAYLVMRLYDGRDLRLLGTGNVTSTAVMVHSGRMPGTVSLLGEIFKTFLCLYIVYLLDAALWAYLVMLVSAAVGQIWSVWLKGAGGRGQTIFVTGFLVLCPIPFLFAGVSYLLTLRLTGRSYFANQLFHVLTPFALMLSVLFNPAILGLGEHSWGYCIVGAIFSGLFFYKQRRENDDIVRSQAWGTYSR